MSRDKGGPHYRYHDDPYLTPISTFERRMFSLSKESGRKAASWIKDSNPELFSHLRDDPVIKVISFSFYYVMLQFKYLLSVDTEL